MLIIQRKLMLLRLEKNILKLFKKRFSGDRVHPFAFDNYHCFSCKCSWYLSKLPFIYSFPHTLPLKKLMTHGFLWPGSRQCHFSLRDRTGDIWLSLAPIPLVAVQCDFLITWKMKHSKDFWPPASAVEVCVCVSICVSVCERSHGWIDWHTVTKLRPSMQECEVVSD